MRRGRRIPLTNKQIRETKQKERPKRRRALYSEKQRQAFFQEYKRICKKYGCAVGLLGYGSIWKVNPKEEIYKLSAHLENVKKSLNFHYET